MTPCDLPAVVERPLAPSRVRPVRFYWLFPHESHLSDYVLLVREWFGRDESEPPAESVYAVQSVPFSDHGRQGYVYLLVRANPLPLHPKLFDDAGCDGREFCCYVPHDLSTPGSCDCKGYRTFARCTHLESLTDAHRRSVSAQTSEAEPTPDADLEAWVLRT